MATPQLRGPSVEVGFAAVHALVLACVFPLAVHAADPELERRSFRPTGWYRAAAACVLFGANTALINGAVALAEGHADSGLAGVRNMAIVGGVLTVVARTSSFAAAASVLLAYLGCVLFVGIAPDGSVEWWAHVLAPWNGSTDAAMTVVGLVLILAAFGRELRVGGTSGGDISQH